MDLGKGIPVADRNLDQLIEAVDTCCLCGAKLNFYHIANFLKHEVQEEARCAHCGVRNKVNTFTLH